MQLKERMKRIRFLRNVVVPVKRFYYHKFLFLLGNIKGIFRNRKKYSDLYQLKDKFSGKRCFIVCTGPSLTFDDLDSLKNEICFSMNSIIKVFDKTSWRPTFYGIQDVFVYDKLYNQLKNTELNNVFVCDDIKKKKRKLVSKTILFPLNFYGHEYFDYGKENPRFNFSKDICKNVFDGYSITYSLIQIAVYLGFSEIYLIGCDCNYSPDPEKQHFVSSGHIDPNAVSMGKLQNQAFICANEFAKKNKISIFNATRGGKLEVFPRVDLENILKNNNLPN